MLSTEKPATAWQFARRLVALIAKRNGATLVASKV
jgi:hypothetical protein